MGLGPTILLGRPTDHSITLNVVLREETTGFVEYGPDSEPPILRTALLTGSADLPIETVLDHLSADTRYIYRLRYKRPSERAYRASAMHSFHTQKSPSHPFTYTLTSDAHLRWALSGKQSSLSADLFGQTLRNVLDDQPDFHIDLGDTFVGDESGDATTTFEYALELREHLGLVSHSVPLFVALGNHDGALGWCLDGTSDNLAVWSANARKQYFLNPVPDGFYSGDERRDPLLSQDGLRESYFAWVWGDALFVVLDPYAYTLRCPHGSSPCDTRATYDGWDWTLGDEQYRWLKRMLEDSDQLYRFVFSHQTTGGVDLYGRGGIEGAKHYEWGGYEADGRTWGFSTGRPGWPVPVHQLLVRTGVDIFFHGHDHLYARQELDGVIYQAVPQPSNLRERDPAIQAGYRSGVILGNSGHLRVSVSPETVTVDYVRACLPAVKADGLNRQVAHSYSLVDARR